MKLCLRSYKPVRYVAKRATTIGNIVSPSVFPRTKLGGTTWLSMKGFHRCGHSLCKACQFACVGKTFSSTSIPNLLTFEIGSHINYNSKWIIYLTACKEFQVQYVGCTSNLLKVCIRRHLSDVTNMSTINISTVSKHFLIYGHREGC